jgi:hypothetical protein
MIASFLGALAGSTFIAAITHSSPYLRFHCFLCSCLYAGRQGLYGMVVPRNISRIKNTSSIYDNGGSSRRRQGWESTRLRAPAYHAVLQRHWPHIRNHIAVKEIIVDQMQALAVMCK